MTVPTTILEDMAKGVGNERVLAQARSRSKARSRSPESLNRESKTCQRLEPVLSRDPDNILTTSNCSGQEHKDEITMGEGGNFVYFFCFASFSLIF